MEGKDQSCRGLLRWSTGRRERSSTTSGSEYSNVFRVVFLWLNDDWHNIRNDSSIRRHGHGISAANTLNCYTPQSAIETPQPASVPDAPVASHHLSPKRRVCRRSSLRRRCCCNASRRGRINGNGPHVCHVGMSTLEWGPCIPQASWEWQYSSAANRGRDRCLSVRTGRRLNMAAASFNARAGASRTRKRSILQTITRSRDSRDRR